MGFYDRGVFLKIKLEVFMKRLASLAVTCLMVVVFANLAYAEGNKIGTIDMNKVMNESKQGKSIQATMNKIYQEKQAEAEKYYQKIKTLSDQISAETPAMKQDAKSKLMKQYQQATQELKKFEESADNELQAKKASLVRPLQETLIGMINDYAKKNGFDFIIVREALLVAPDNMDITQTILDEIDKAYLDNLAKEKPQETKAPAKTTSDSKDKTKDIPKK
jgi:outer membrane protein